MKKFSIIAALVVAAIVSSCGNGTPKADLKEELDTLSYAAGMTQSQGLKNYLAVQMGVDTTYMDEFIKGLNESAKAGDDPKSKAYYAGVQIGHQISSQIVRSINYQLFGPEDSVNTVSVDNFLAGFVAGVTEKGGLMTVHEADSTAMAKFQSFRQKQMEKEYGEWKTKNEEYMASVAKKEGVQALSDGIFYEVEVAGKGEVPTADSKVKVNYEGKIIDGTVFDSSYKRNEPAVFPVGGVIPGWAKALQAMPVGSKWTLYIPQEQAYGAANTGGMIKPYSALIFTFELLGIEK